MLHIKFQGHWPSGFRGDVWKCLQHTHTHIHTYRRHRPTYPISSPLSLKAQESLKLMSYCQKDFLKSRLGVISPRGSVVLWLTCQTVIVLGSIPNGVWVPISIQFWVVSQNFRYCFQQYYKPRLGAGKVKAPDLGSTRKPEDHWSCIAHLRAEDMLN